MEIIPYTRETDKQKARRKELSVIRRQSFMGWTSITYTTQISSSKQRQHPRPTYTLNELREWLSEQPNLDSIVQSWRDSGFKSKLKPSIDRLNDNLGYSFDNIRLVTWEENNRKQKEKEFLGDSVMARRVYQLDIETEEILAEFASISIAQRTIGGAISDCLNGRGNTAAGYKWKYKIDK